MKIVEKFIQISNKFFYSVFFSIITLILLIGISIKFNIKILFCVIIYILIIIYWIWKLIHIPKNKSQKYGIIFIVDNSNYYNEVLNQFFKKVNFTLSDDFKIFIFNKNFIKNFSKENSIEKLMKDKNYQMAINSFSLDAKENADPVYSLSQKDITFISPQLEEKTANELKKELSNSFLWLVKLREKNSYKDIHLNADIMSASIRYFVSIIFIIFGNIKKAEKEINSIDINSLDSNAKEAKYLKKGIPKIRFNIYYLKASKYLLSKKYLYDKEELEKLKKEESVLSSIVKEINNIPEIVYDNNGIKAKIAFAEKNYNEAIHYTNMMLKKPFSDYTVTISYAFLLIMTENVLKGINQYKKTFKKNVSEETIDDCISFIDSSLKNPIHKKEYLLLSKGLIIYYWIDKELGKKIIKESYENITNEEIKKQLEVRYIK